MIDYIPVDKYLRASNLVKLIKEIIDEKDYEASYAQTLGLEGYNKWNICFGWDNKPLGDEKEGQYRLYGRFAMLPKNSTMKDYNYDYILPKNKNGEEYDCEQIFTDKTDEEIKENVLHILDEFSKYVDERNKKEVKLMEREEDNYERQC